jgi:hypothetical protein
MLLLSLSLTGPLCAAENVSAEARVVGSTFKTLAKAYVATADIAQLKAKNIKRIEGMKDEWFDLKYTEVYRVIKALPAQVRTKYGITEDMTKAQAVRVIQSLDKNKIYDIIDKIPDPVIAEEFNRQLKDDEEQGGNLMSKINKVWDKIVAGINKTTSHRSP